MEIYRTFDQQYKGIYLARFVDCDIYETPNPYENEFSKSLDTLTDPFLIREMIKSPNSGWKKGNYKNTPIKELVEDVLNEMDDLITKSSDIRVTSQTDSIDWLLDNFKPLSDEDLLKRPERLKMYTYEYRSLLRLYGIQLGNETVIITGITIKLAHKMQQCYLTKQELNKMNYLRSWLLDNNIIETDQL